MDLSPDLAARAEDWASLKRWERRELAQDLRRLGLSYREIQQFLPVAKGTLSEWCRDIELTPDQEARLADAQRSKLARSKAGRTRRARHLKRVADLREGARQEALSMTQDPFWVAGVVAYWAEGGKRPSQMVFSNSDASMVRLFLRWSATYLQLTQDRYLIRLHLHDGQDEDAARSAWATLTGIPTHQFRRAYIKREGTGHRKNLLYAGTAQVRVTRSVDLLHRVLGWIDTLSAETNYLR